MIEAKTSFWLFSTYEVDCWSNNNILSIFSSSTLKLKIQAQMMKEISYVILYILGKQNLIDHRTNLARPVTFVSQYMRMLDQANHLIFSICTRNHEVVVFYNTSSLVIFPHYKGPVIIFTSSLFFRFQNRHQTNFHCTCAMLIIFWDSSNSQNYYWITKITNVGGITIITKSAIWNN